MRILGILGSIFPSRAEQDCLRAAHEIYVALVQQARTPALFAGAGAGVGAGEGLGISDDVDGRFDSIVLHVALMVRRLDAEGGEGGDVRADALSNELVGVFNDDMDRNLREMGVGDLSVGKHVKKMAQAFFGRFNAYRDALASEEGADALKAALRRNVFRDREDVSAAQVEALAAYVKAYQAHLEAQPLEALLRGELAVFDAKSE